MTTSLIPEKPLLISPGLAATIGLEEATMLCILADLVTYRDTINNGGYQWLEVDNDILIQAMPFWSELDIQRISKSLRDKGIILISSAPFGGDLTFKFALNEKTSPANDLSTHQAPEPEQMNVDTFNRPIYATSQPDYTDQLRANVANKQEFADAQYSRNKRIIPPNWLPSEDVLKQIKMRGVPHWFAVAQIPEFVTFWSERREAHFSWGSKFLKSVVISWEKHQAEVAEKETNHSISSHWRPSEDALTILHRLDIPSDFVEDAIPEFVLYWTERGQHSKTWNSKFITHVKLQWARVNSTLEHDNQPTRIDQHWQPSEDVYDVLKLANIDVSFAQSLVKEFVIFWRDANELSRSWNTKFLQHVKFHWAKQHNLATSQLTNPTGNYHARQQHTARTSNERTKSTFERLTDRSWAEGIEEP